MKKPKFKPITANDDGWSDWIHPKMSGYLMKCCDCGLVHELQFQVTKVTERKRNGWKKFKIVDDPDYEVSFRAARKPKNEMK